MKYGRLYSFIILALIIVVQNESFKVFAYEDTVELIELSEEKILDTFKDLQLAYEAGVDVSEQLNELNEIADYLNEAKYSLEQEHSEEKISEIEDTISQIYILSDEAKTIREVAFQQKENIQNSLITRTFLYLAILGIIIYGINRYLNSTRDNQILDHKPEVKQYHE
jgi:hypothetical protein